jgi:pimeloyl-ACP methyl ester carboxylesterase
MTATSSTATATTQLLSVNGLRMQVTTAGAGPLVLLCHGFPELAHSWRHQVAALAGAGFRVAAPDMRGYGGTDAPEAIDQYTLLHLVGDMVDLVKVLGETQAVVVGHDWGAAVAWHCALLRPDLFRAVAGLSVPYAPPGRVDLITSLDNAGIHDFYMQYFQAPGVAEAELDRDLAASIRRIHYSGSGDAPARNTFGRLGQGGLLDNTCEPPTPCRPGWAPTTWPPTPRPMPATAFAAGSTGTATCAATPRCCRPGAASRSASRRCSSPARATTC